MKDKDLNKIAAIEKAVSQKYGQEAIQNPQANWDEEKEKEYLFQLKEFYKIKKPRESWEDKINVNGIKATKKLLNRESLVTCPVCGNFPQKTLDDVCLLKFDCCSKCYVQYVEGREERWKKGWRPNENK